MLDQQNNFCLNSESSLSLKNNIIQFEDFLKKKNNKHMKKVYHPYPSTKINQTDILQRLENIKKSIERINSLSLELKAMSIKGLSQHP